MSAESVWTGRLTLPRELSEGQDRGGYGAGGGVSVFDVSRIVKIVLNLGIRGRILS